MASWQDTRERLRHDKQRLLDYARQAGVNGINWPSASWSLWFYPAYQCVLLHRLSHFFFSNGHRLPARLLWHLNCILTGADISPNTDIAGGLLIKSPIRVTAVGRAGENLTIDGHGGFGGGRSSNDIGAGPGLPIVGDNVTIRYGSMILGPVYIGNQVILEARTNISKNIPDNTRVVLTQRVTIDHQSPTVSLDTPPAHSADERIAMSFWSLINRDILQYIRYSSAFSGNDAGVLRKVSALLTPSVSCVFLYRLSHLMHRWRLSVLALLLAKVNYLLHRASIAPVSEIGPGLYIPHTSGVTFHGQAGCNLVLYYHAIVTASDTHLDKTRLYTDCPVLGDDVIVGSSATVLGAVRIGDRCVVGINSAVYQSLAPDTSVISRETSSLQPIDRIETEAGVPSVQRHDTQQLSWRQTRQFIRQDWQQLRACYQHDNVSPPWYLGLTRSFHAAALFRLSSYFLCNGHPRNARLMWHINLWFTGADINPQSVIGGGLVIDNPAGINDAADIVRNCILSEGVGLLAAPDNFQSTVTQNWPRVGDNVNFKAGAIASGPVIVGDDATIFAKCFIAQKIPQQSWVTPPKAIHKRQRMTENAA